MDTGDQTNNTVKTTVCGRFTLLFCLKFSLISYWWKYLPFVTWCIPDVSNYWFYSFCWFRTVSEA